MSYTKHNYKKGDELLASQLNDMDDQIALNEQTSDTLVTVSNTQPAAAKNRVWVKATPSEIEIPTMDDHNELSRQLSDVEENQIPELKNAISDIAGSDVTIEGKQIEVTDPPANMVVKTNNTAGRTVPKLVVSKGNILCLPYYRPNNYQTNGLTFTINDDKSITVNGTATADTIYNIAYYQDAPVFGKIVVGNYRYGFMMSGCTDGSKDTYYIDEANTGYVCTTAPVGIFGSGGRNVNLRLVVKSGVTLTNKTFYPMLSYDGTEEFTSPVTPYTATVASTDEEYTWDDLTFFDGYNLIATSSLNTLTATYPRYKTIAEVETEIEALNDRIDDVAVDQWTDKKWVAFGTSITDNYSQNSYITQGEHAGEHTGKYVPYLLDMSKLSSSAFVNHGISGGSINGHILYYIRYYTSDMANADLITIEGAVNDFAASVPLGQVGDTVPYTNNLLPDSTADGTFAGACYQAFTTALTNAPNAVVVLLTETTGKNHVGYADYGQLRKNDLGLYQDDYIKMTMDVAEFVGIPVINCGRDSMINVQNPQYIADHIHHTYLGGYQYATVIWDKLKYIPLKCLTVPDGT